MIFNSGLFYSYPNQVNMLSAFYFLHNYISLLQINILNGNIYISMYFQTMSSMLLTKPSTINVCLGAVGFWFWLIIGNALKLMVLDSDVKTDSIYLLFAIHVRTVFDLDNYACTNIYLTLLGINTIEGSILTYKIIKWVVYLYMHVVWGS